MIRLLIILIGGVAISSCFSKKVTDEPGLYEFLKNPDHGTAKTIDKDGFQVMLIYRPAELTAKQMMSAGTYLEFDSLSRLFSHYVYFTIEISFRKKSLEDPDLPIAGNFAQHISYLSSDFSEDIKLLADGEYHEPVDFVYARSYGIGPSQFLIVFNKPASEKFSIEIAGSRLGFGTLSFPFRQSDFANTPTLKLDLL